MGWLEHKYIGLLSGKFRNFKRKNNNYNFSCPVCGDSKTNKLKARGWLLEKKGNLFFYCHNCGASSNFKNFLKKIDVNLFNEYNIESIKNSNGQVKDTNTYVEKMKKPVFRKTGPLKELKKISQLSHTDPAKIFIEQRKIPTTYHAELFKTDTFKKFVNSVVEDKFSPESLKKDEPRIIIPFFDKNKKLFGFQGRSIYPSDIKYITILLELDSPKVFGLDRVNLSKTVYVFEGPFDSMFIPNSIASAGGDIVSVLESLDNSIKENMVVIYDNERRSKETVKKITKAINKGYKVCIWPKSFKWKDVNDAVVAGLTPKQIKDIIDNSTKKDLAAKLELQQWKMM